MCIKILIVEDLFIEANDLKLILEKAGHTVLGVVKSVDQAMAFLKREKPEMVLLDIFLKGPLTGIHLAHYLSGHQIPFIYLSANSNPSTLEAAKATKPYGFLVKPYREKDILLALDIADHRHKQMLERATGQEKWLGNLLSAITAEMISQEQKLLLLVKAFRNFISFDQIYIDTDAGSERPDNFYGFERVGLEEYQTLPIPELLKKTKLSLEDLNSFRRDAQHKKSKFADRLCQVFHLQSFLSVPLGTEAVSTKPLQAERSERLSISFFSLQHDCFTAEQAGLLRQLTGMLTTVIRNVGRPADRFGPKDTTGSTKEGIFITPEQQTAIRGILGKSPKLLHVLDQVIQVAEVASTVLLTGETGVGKEGLASAIHQLSPRKNKPLIKINCAAIPENLLESELFGHERGSFTGALDKRIGKFEQGQGGTIFLDEIGELPLPAQAKLLRVLQEKEIERIGGHAPIKIDIRIITATNRNLYKEVAEGRFRIDLYYRIQVFPIHVPPLRERKEDIPILVNHFLHTYAGLYKDRPRTVTPGVMKQLTEYSWPGNIRELQHLIERNVISSRLPVISSIEFPEETFFEDVFSKGAEQIKRTLQPEAPPSMEKSDILEALKTSNGKISGRGGAAELLGIKPNTLTGRMKKMGISWTHFSD